MNIRKSLVFTLVAFSIAMLRAGIADVDALMEVLWYNDAVANFDSTQWTEGTAVTDGKIAIDEKITYTPAAQAGTAVRQVFDVEPEPVADFPEVVSSAQTAIAIKDGKLCAYGKTSADATAAEWVELGDRTTGAIALEIDYATSPATIRLYQGDATEQTGATLYSATAATKVTAYDFEGAGTLKSLSGTQTADTAAMIGTKKYASLADAVAAYEDGDEIVVIKEGQTAPDGWQIADGRLVPAETKVYVAQIGETKYETLEAALAAEVTGDVVLLGDITLTAELAISGTKVIDLGEHTITGAFGGDDIVWVRGGSNVTIKNGKVKSTGEAGYAIYVSKGATLTVAEDATVESATQGVYLSSSTAVVNGEVKAYNGVVLATDNELACSLTVNGKVTGTNLGVTTFGENTINSTLVINEGAEVTASAGTAVYVAGPADATIAGTVTGSEFGVYVKSGDVTVTSTAAISSTATEYEAPSANNSGTSGKGVAFVVEALAEGAGGYAGGATVTIEGGTFESVGAPVVSWTRDAEAAEALTGFIEGGSFKGDAMPTDLIKVGEGEVASWGEVDENGYTVAVVTDAPVTVPAASYSLDYNNELNTPSTILGGVYLPSNGDGFDSYTTLRGGDETGVVVGSAGNRKGAYYNQSFVQNGADWSISIVAQTVAAENAVIWSVGGKNIGTKSGIALVRKTTDTVALASWTESGLTELATATVPLMDRQLHNYIVTFDYSELTYTLYVDGVAGGTATVEAECVFSNAFQAGGVHGGAPTGVNVSTGFIFDELGMWNGTALTAAQAAEVASNYPVYPIIRTLVWNNENEDWTDDVQAYADGTETLVDITANDIIVFRNPTKVLYDKRSVKAPVNFVVESGTLKIGHDSSTENNLPADSTVTVNAGAAVELRCWNVDGQGNSVFLPGVTFNGEGRVYVHSTITAVHLGALRGTTPVDLGNATVEFNWFKDKGINGSITSPIYGRATINAYDGLPAMTFVEGENGWTGTVKVPSIVSASWANLAQYGIAGSKIELAGIEQGYLAVNNTIASTLKLTGNVNLTDGSRSSTITIAKLDGTGDFSVTKNTTYVFETIAATYTGTLTNGSGSEMKVKVVETALETVPAEKTKVLATSGTLTTTDLVVKLANGTAVDAAYVSVEDDGIYVAQKAEGWASVTESTLLSAIPGLTTTQVLMLDAHNITAPQVAEWAQKYGVSYGADIDAEAFAMNCAPADKTDEAAKLKVTITMKADGTPEVSCANDTTGYNIQPTIKGKVELTDEKWSDALTGKKFFKAFIEVGQ